MGSLRTMRELTDRSQDRTNDSDVAWRGRPYFAEIRPVLPATFEFGVGVADSQRCWVGYNPSTDEFLAGYDLWLDVSEDDVKDDDDLMAGGLVTLKLEISGERVIASAVKRERLPKSIYSGGTLDDIKARYPEHIEIDVD
jgi:hypothetical protein